MGQSSKLNPDFILKISIAIAVLIAASAIGYYYVIFLPHKESALIDIQRQEQAAKAQQAADAAEEEANKEIMLEACLIDARSNYDLNWANACKVQLATAQAGLETCNADAEFCRDLWGPTIEQSADESCTLKGGAGDKVNDQYTEDKDECYKRYGA